MFYIGGVIFTLCLYFSFNWSFYLGGYLQQVVTSVFGFGIFLFLAGRNIKYLSQQGGEKYSYFLLAPISVLTLFGVSLLLTIIKVSSIILGLFGWVLTTNQGWQFSPGGVVARLPIALDLVLMLIFYLISTIAYDICRNYRRI